MKSNKALNEESDESFISPKLSEKERLESIEVFKEYRRKVVSKRTHEDKLKIQLLQLKFLMEDYLRADTYDKTLSFSYFLKQYIARLEKRNNEFAEEMNIKPTELSQLINNHRDPNQKFIMRLEAHSNRIFPAIMWFKLFTKEKALELLKDDALRITEGKQVKKRLQFYI
jgi:hypothetical protein